MYARAFVRDRPIMAIFYAFSLPFVHETLTFEENAMPNDAVDVLAAVNVCHVLWSATKY